MTVSKVLRSFITLLFLSLFLVVPLLFTSVNEELFEFNKMLAVYVITLGISACWISLCLIEKKLIWKKTPLDIPIILFVGSQVISTIFSINIHTSIFGYYTRFNGGLLSVFSYVILYYSFIAFVNKKQLYFYLNALIIGGALSALYALPEHFGHSPSCLLFSGKFDVACWVQDVKSRVFGTFGQPNWLAAYLGMLLPLAIVNTKIVTTELKLMEDDSSKKWFSFIIRLCVVFLFCAVLFYTGSRSGIGGVAGGLALLGVASAGFLYLTKRKKLNPNYQLAIFSYLRTLGLACLIFALSIFIFPNPVLDKINSLLPHLQTKISAPIATIIPKATATTPVPTAGTQLDVGGSESGVIRSVVWKGALRVWQRYPIFGSGVETFAYSYYRDRLKEHNVLSEWDFLYNKAHNEFLNYLATTGIIGFLAYIILLSFMILYPIILSLRPYLSLEHKKHEQTELIVHDTFLLIALASGVIIVSISNFFGFSTVMVSVLLFIFSAMSVIITGSNWQDLPKEKETESLVTVKLIDYTMLAVVFLFSAFGLLAILRLWNADVSFAHGKQLDNSNQFEQAYPFLRDAVNSVGDEPTYRDEYSNNLATLAVLFAQQKAATQASDFASQAIEQSDIVIAQNSVHTNFWKTRIRVFLTLSQLDVNFYQKAEEALQIAHSLSPTDPKLVYYLALIAQVKKDNAGYKNYLLEAIDLKPNYEEARAALGKHYEDLKQPTKALEQYKYMVQFINPNNLDAQARIASISANLK